MNHSARGRPALPPGPRGRRLCNYFLRLFRYADFMERLHEEYGDIVYYELPRLKCCAVFDADLIREVLVTREPLFPPWAPGGREPNKLMEYGCLPVHTGEEHRRRSDLVRTAFAGDRLNGYRQVVSEQAAKLRDRLRPGSVVDLRSHVERYAWDAVVRTVIGQDVHRDHGLRIMRLLKAAMLLDLLPFGESLKKVGPKPPTAALDEAIYDAIRRARTSSHEGRDLISHLVRAADQGLADWSYENDRALRDEIIAFMCAFTDAPTTVVCFAFHHLARNPEVRRRVEREVVGVLGDRPVHAADYDRLPYLQAVFRETLRLEPPAYVMRAREAREDCVLGGYLIPKGTLTYVGMRVLHHKDRHCERAGEFRPERWLDDSGPCGPPRPEHACIPFGEGPHSCSGSDLAAMLFVFAVAAVTQRLRLEPTTSAAPARENIGVGVSGFRVKVEERAGAQAVTGSAAR